MFAGFETGFRAFVVNFLALWMLLGVDCMYRRQDRGKSVCSPALKPVIRHSPFFFSAFEVFFESIIGIVAKIRA